MSTEATFTSDELGDALVYISSQGWSSYTMSSNEMFIAAISSGNIYTWSTTDGATPPATSVQQTLSGNYDSFFWPMASGGNFVLQQSTSLGTPNWTNVFWPVVISGWNYQVTVPCPGASAFFQLKEQ